MDLSTYVCPKCGSEFYAEDMVQRTGGNLSRYLDVHTKRFNTVTCADCGYTEIYNMDSSLCMDLIDLSKR